MFILASQSPRRKEILSKLVDDFVVIPSNFDEDSITVSDNYKLSEVLSFHKALEVYLTHKDDTILACDTIVLFNDEVLGKPKDKDDAIRMLTMLSGNKHTVVSGYTYMNKDKIISRTVISYVYFNELTHDEIVRYVESGSPMDKAGSYGVQDKDFPVVKKIEGIYYNVMGLPLEDIKDNCF